MVKTPCFHCRWHRFNLWLGKLCTLSDAAKKKKKKIHLKILRQSTDLSFKGGWSFHLCSPCNHHRTQMTAPSVSPQCHLSSQTQKRLPRDYFCLIFIFLLMESHHLS